MELQHPYTVTPSGGYDAGKNQLSRILRVLKDEGFQLKGVSDSRFIECYKEATFIKDVPYTRAIDNNEVDDELTIRIEFDPDYDHETLTRDRYDGWKDCLHKTPYTNKEATRFITTLYDQLLTTADQAAVDQVAQAKHLPKEIGTKIRDFVGKPPKGGKTRRVKRRSVPRRTTRHQR